MWQRMKRKLLRLVAGVSERAPIWKRRLKTLGFIIPDLGYLQG